MEAWPDQIVQFKLFINFELLKFEITTFRCTKFSKIGRMENSEGHIMFVPNKFGFSYQAEHSLKTKCGFSYPPEHSWKLNQRPQAQQKKKKKLLSHVCANIGLKRGQQNGICSTATVWCVPFPLSPILSACKI